MGKIIGIAAQLANGKDVVADYLVQQLNKRNKTGTWVRAAFANAVKKVFEDSFGVDREFVEQWKRNPDPPPGMKMNVRKGLQFIGDGFRQIKENIWIEIALRDETQKVISDSRYINEAKAIYEENGNNIVLWRPGYENDDPNPSESQIYPIVKWCLDTQQDGVIIRNSRGFPKPPDGIQYYDYFLRNDGTIEQLYSKIDEHLIPLIELHWTAWP